MMQTALAESIGTHVYIGVDCKQCRKFTVLREIARGTEIADALGQHQLKCADGHQNLYAVGDFYTLESSTSYAPNTSTRRGGLWERFGRLGSGKELFLVSLILAQVLALMFVLLWRYL